MNEKIVRIPRATQPLFAAVVALAILTVAPAFCQPRSPHDDYHDDHHSLEFTKVVDTTQGFNAFGEFPAFNNHGEVAFRAVRDGVGFGVFRLSGPLEKAEKVTTIVSTADNLDAFGDDVTINPSGVVAFTATTPSNSRVIYKGNGTSKTLIVDSTASGIIRIGLGAPSINAAGTVAFSATLAQRGSPVAIFTGNGGPLTTIASTSPTGFAGFGNVAINDRGTIVFAAGLRDGSHGVFTISGALVDIIDTNQHPEIDNFGDPVINGAGTIADFAGLFPFDVPEVFTGNARGITRRNDPANPAFQSLEHPSLNNSGAVAFSAIFPFAGAVAPTGIFLEVSGGQSLIPVVRPGDHLFGSIVDHVNLGRFALNDRFQMVFSYTLTDGRSGIAIADFNGEKEGDDQSH